MIKIVIKRLRLFDTFVNNESKVSNSSNKVNDDNPMLEDVETFSMFAKTKSINEIKL